MFQGSTDTLPKLTPATPDCTVPAKGPVRVDDAKWVEGGVHRLLGTQQVHQHGNAQVSNQNAQRNVHHPTYQHTYSMYTHKQTERVEWHEKEQLETCEILMGWFGSIRDIGLSVHVCPSVTLHPDTAFYHFSRDWKE